MRYSLRALLIVMLLGGPLGAWGWRRLNVYWEAKAASPAVTIRVPALATNPMAWDFAYPVQASPPKPGNGETPQPSNAPGECQVFSFSLGYTR